MNHKQSVYWFNTLRPRAHLHSMHLRKIIALCFDSSFIEVCLNGPTDNKSWGNSLVLYRREDINWINGDPNHRCLRSQCRHNECDGVSNHRRLHCVLNCCSRCTSKKTSKFRVTGLCVENSPVTGEFPTQKASYAEMFPFASGYIQMTSSNGIMYIYIYARHLPQWVTSYEDSWQLQTWLTISQA